MTTALPLAIAPSTRSPGVGLIVNFLANASSPGTSALRGCVIACADSTGTLAPGAILQSIAGESVASAAYGPGMLGHKALKRIFLECPAALVDIVSCVVPVGAPASAIITFDDASPVTSARTITVTIAGRDIVIAWLVGETKVQAATKLVAAISADDADLPVIATNGGGTLAAVTIPAKGPGTWGNDIQIYLTVVDGAGGTIVLSGTSGNALSGGTTEMNITSALTLISNTEYDYILVCTSNTDCNLGTNGSNPGKLKAHILTYGSGKNAKLQQGIFGNTSQITAAKVGPAGLNFGNLQDQICVAGQSLPAEWGASEMGARMREVSLDPKVNRIGMLYRPGLVGARDRVNDTLSPAEEEDALFSGLSPVVYDSTGQPAPLRPVTMYFKDSAGNADDRILDTSRVDGLYTVSKDIRVSLPQQFPGVSLSPDLPEGDDEIPPGVVEVREVRDFIIERLHYWANKRGVLNRIKLAAAIADGTLIVQVDPTDDAQCDIVLPLRTVPPLAKFSIYVKQAA